MWWKVAVRLRTWTAADACGNTAQHVQTITVTDVTAPVFTNPPANISVDCNAVPAVTPVTASDNCDPTITVVYVGEQNNVVEGCGTITRTWTAADACGNTAQHVQTITVTDVTAPVFTNPPANISVDCNAVPAVTPVTASDNCDPTITVVYVGEQNNVVEGCGTIVRTWTAADACGNTAQHVQTITVTDVTAPVFTNPPANISVDCNAVPAVTPVTASDNCDPTITVVYVGEQNNVVEGCGTIVRTWTAADACGNTAQHVQTITVTDVTAPVFTNPPANISVDCNAVPAVTPVTASDNCDPTITVVYVGEQNNVVEGCGTIYRTWTAADACGNTAQHVQTITVTDVTAPVFTNPPANISVDCNAVPAVTPVTASDNCDPTITVVYVGEQNNVVEGCGTIVRTWTAADACGNTAQHVQTITVTDVTAPVFTNPPANISVDCNAVPAVTPVTASDNCDPTITVVYVGEQNNVVEGCGTIVRTWTAADACGNTAQHVQTITVTDVTAPVFTNPPANISVDCNAVPAVTPVTASDNCDPTITVVYVGEQNNVVEGCGTITRTWTAADACGNTAQHVQTITVTDVTAPVFTNPPANISVDCNAVPAVTPVTASDNCDPTITVVYVGEQNNVVEGCGTIVRTWTAADACGNTAQHVQTITVTDVTAPVFTNPPANISVDCNAVPAVTPVTASDNCDPTITVVYVGEQNNVVEGCGTITRTWTAADACGNTAQHVQTITVTDVTAPVFTNPPANISVDCNAVPAVTPVTASDNCDPTITVVYVGEQNNVVEGCGTIVRTWTAADACGNTAQHVQTITVTDVTAPVFTNPPANISVDCNAVPAVTPVTASDNCDPTITVVYVGEQNNVVEGCGTIVQNMDSC